MLKDIDVKYVGSLDEILNDPNYWQNIFLDQLIIYVPLYRIKTIQEDMKYYIIYL